MKIAHIADAHLGYRQYGFIERELDYSRALERAFADAYTHNPNYILLAGDTFDSMRPPASAVRTVQTLVAQAQGRGIQVIGIDGNHDCTEGHWLKVCGITDLATTKVDRFGGIAWAPPRQFLQTLSTMAKNQPGQLDVLVIHQAIAELAKFGVELKIDDLLPFVKALGVKWVLMGDIHQAGYRQVDGVMFTYPGSLERTASDDDTPKSFNVIDTDSSLYHAKQTPRRWVKALVKTPADVAALAQELPADKHTPAPVFLVTYDTALQDAVTLLDRTLGTALRRFIPLSAAGEGALSDPQRVYERRGVMQSLNAAIGQYFKPDSDEAALIHRLLANPGQAKEIALQYARASGVGSV